MRGYLHEFFPSLMGFGKLYEESKAALSVYGIEKPAYYMNKKRCPKPEDWQDCVYYSLLSRNDIEKDTRVTNSISTAARGNAAKRRRTATQVSRIYRVFHIEIFLLDLLKPNYFKKQRFSSSFLLL